MPSDDQYAVLLNPSDAVRIRLGKVEKGHK